MSGWESKRTDETRRIESLLKEQFENPQAYRYNPASIRVRIVDDRFEGKSVPEREAMVMPLLGRLPKRVREDIIMLILATPDELKTFNTQSLLNSEFEEPSLSRL